MKGFLACLFIFGWWAFAFFDANPIQTIHISYKEELFPTLKREEIHRALLGNPTNKNRNIFPQTYVSADILFALVDPKEIIALPKNFRKNKLIPQKKLDQISREFNCYSSEALYLANPELACVSFYTHPRTLQNLKQMNIPLHQMGPITTFDELKKEILLLGEKANEKKEAELLVSYINSTLKVLDHKHKKRVLYLIYNGKLSLPTEQTLTGHMIKQLKLNQELPTSASWSTPIEIEEIIAYNPDLIILATKESMPLPKALEEFHIVAVDQTLQNTPSQFALLAYYDLVAALVKVK